MWLTLAAGLLWQLSVLLTLLTLPDLRGGRLFLTVLAGAMSLASWSWHLMERLTAKSQRLND